MAKLKEYKHLTEHKPIKTHCTPTKAYVLLRQHLGKPPAAIVKRGDVVKAGQVIATSDAGIFAPVHAPISGKVINIDDCPHPVLGRERAVIIESDKSADIEFKQAKSIEEINKLSADQLRQIIFDAGIVGLGGATFPTHVKLNPPVKIDSLIINGAECEPYLTSDSRLMIEKTDEIFKGVELVARCLGNPKVYIAIEDNKPEAIKEFKNKIRDTRYEIRILETKYPQGGEKQLIENILNRQVPSGKVPFSIGVVVHNVGTIFAIHEAVYLNKPLIERVVTVTGSCLSNPGNFLVRIGTPIKEIIDAAGPLKKEPVKIISGGPMMGIAQFSLDTPVVKGTSGILLLSKDEVQQNEEGVCIRCGECVYNCPTQLMPTLISQASEKERCDLAKDLGVLDCIECGLCSYICPAKIELTQRIKYIKLRCSQ